MTSIERTAYPRFKRYYTEKELREIYTPTSPEKVFSWSHTTGLQNYLNLIILLKTFQRLGYFPQLKNVPLTLINYLKNILNLSEKIKVGYEHQRTEYRHLITSLKFLLENSQRRGEWLKEKLDLSFASKQWQN